MTGIERLRKLIEDYRTGHECDGFECTELSCGKCMAKNVLKPIADQIEREQGEHVSRMRVLSVVTEMERHVSGAEGMEDSPVARWARELRDALKSDTSDGSEAQNPSCTDPDGAADVTSDAQKVTRDPAEDVSMSAYDLLPADEREAIAWVREHGGLEAVKREWRSRVPYDRYERRRQSLLGHIAECETALGRRRRSIEKLGRTIEFFQLNNSNFRHLLADVAERLGFTRFGNDYEPEDLLDALDRRLMPEGMEWLRYDTGEPVPLGGEVTVTVHNEDGDFARTFAIRSIKYKESGVLLEGTKNEMVILSYGERVRRPAVLAADGNRIEPAMDVWWICEGDERGIHAERLHVESIGEDGLVTCGPFNGGTWVELEPSELYVNKPVLDADGVPIDEGDTVWNATTSAGPFTVREIERSDDPDEPEDIVWCGEHAANGFKVWRIADQLTHTKPEPRDSWERIEEDKGLNPFDYCKKVGHKLWTFDNAEEFKSSDLVRRAKKLAGVDND